MCDLLDDGLEHVAHHKDFLNHKSRAEIIRAGIGVVMAADLLPTDLRRWLEKQYAAPAMFDRYKSLISLAYKVGVSNNEVAVSPARMVMHRKEPGGRKRLPSWTCRSSFGGWNPTKVGADLCKRRRVPL